MTTADRRADLVQAYGPAAEILSGIDASQLGLPTPCARYDVRTLVDHLIGAGFRAGAIGRGESPADTEFPHVELADAAEEMRRAGKEAEAAWSDPARLSATTTMPWGESYTGYTLVDMYLAEVATHTWDLAFATGQVDRLDPATPTTALAAARSMLAPGYRDLMEPGSPFGAEVEAPPGATEWERLAAFMGRQPRP